MIKLHVTLQKSKSGFEFPWEKPWVNLPCHAKEFARDLHLHPETIQHLMIFFFFDLANQEKKWSLNNLICSGWDVSTWDANAFCLSPTKDFLNCLKTGFCAHTSDICYYLYDKPEPINQVYHIYKMAHKRYWKISYNFMNNCVYKFSPTSYREI